MQFCRICLNTDRKMYIFDSTRIHLYEQITGITFVSRDLPNYVCWECGYYMSKYVAFKSKAMKSQYVLTEILNREGLITKSSCNQYKFKSNLAFTNVLYLYVKEEETDNSLESSDIKIEKECKESNVNDFTDVKDDVILVHGDDDQCNDETSVIDNQYSDDTIMIDNQYSDDTVMTDNLILSPPSNNGTTIGHKKLVKQNKKSQVKLSSNAQRQGKKKACEVNAEIKNSNNGNNDSIENKDLVQENKKLQVKPTCNVQRKRKKKACVVNAEIKNSNRNATKQVSAKRKRESTVIEKKVYGSFMNEIDESIINFTELTLDEQIAEIQNRKECDNYKNSPFKCEKCFKGFLDVNTFDRHTALHADSSGALECPLCRKRYAFHRRLTQHMRSHMYRFSCQQCSFSTSSLNVAQKHQNVHKGTRHECPHCKEIYIHRTSLLGHIRKKHPSDFICPHCGLSFVNDMGLTKHVKWVHRSEQTPVPQGGPNCALCDIRFYSQQAFDNHVLVSAKHADERQRMGVSFAYRVRKNTVAKKQERRKESTHTSKLYPDGPRQCEQCDEKLPNPRAYHIHFKNVHKDKNRTLFYNKWGERHMCEICGKLFQSASLLRSHQYAHSESKEFKCDRCGKRFQLELHLWNHQRNHCGTRVDYPCSVCGKTFSSMSNRSRHMVTHKGYAYKCEMCDKVFNCPGNKKNHIDFVHKKKPWPKRNRGARKRTEPERQPEAMMQNQPREADMEEDWNTP